MKVWTVKAEALIPFIFTVTAEDEEKALELAENIDPDLNQERVLLQIRKWEYDVQIVDISAQPARRE